MKFLRYLMFSSLTVLASAAALAGPVTFSALDPALKWGPCPPIFSDTCRVASLHGAADQPNADVFFQLMGGDTIPHHWHNSAERILLVSGVLQVQYDGLKAEVLLPGMYAYGPPKAPHKGKCVSMESCVLFIAFVAPVDAFLVE